MKRPQPPYGASLAQPPQSFEDASSSLSIPAMPPHPTFIEQLEEMQESLLLDDAVIEKTSAGAGFDAEQVRLCENCKNYWGIKNLAAVKNLKPDGSPFTQREDFCIFADKLFALSERMVYSCTRFEKKD